MPTIANVGSEIEELMSYLGLPLSQVLDLYKPNLKDQSTVSALKYLEPHLAEELHSFLCWVAGETDPQANELVSMDFLGINPFEVLLPFYYLDYGDETD